MDYCKREKQNEEIETMFFHLLYQIRTINRLYSRKINAEINEDYSSLVSHLNENNLKRSFLADKLPM